MFVNTVGTKQIQCLVDLVQEALIKITNLRETEIVPAISAESDYYAYLQREFWALKLAKIINRG